LGGATGVGGAAAVEMARSTGGNIGGVVFPDPEPPTMPRPKLMPGNCGERLLLWL